MHSPQIFLNKYIIEEKSWRHVSTVAKFLDDNKPKREIALFQTSSILFNFIYFVKCWRNFLGLNPKGSYLLHLLHKAGEWNWEVSCRGRATTAKKGTKRRDARAKAIAFLSFSLPSPSSLIGLPIVVIKKFGYHGNWAGCGLRLGATVKNPASGQYGTQSSVASTFMRVPRAAEHSLW